MKFTLKNCPDSEWKRGFEKELREKLEQFDESECEYYIIEEILGE